MPANLNPGAEQARQTSFYRQELPSMDEFIADASFDSDYVDVFESAPPSDFTDSRPITPYTDCDEDTCRDPSVPSSPYRKGIDFGSSNTSLGFDFGFDLGNTGFDSLPLLSGPNTGNHLGYSNYNQGYAPQQNPMVSGPSGFSAYISQMATSNTFPPSAVTAPPPPSAIATTPVAINTALAGAATAATPIAAIAGAATAATPVAAIAQVAATVLVASTAASAQVTTALPVTTITAPLAPAATAVPVASTAVPASIVFAPIATITSGSTSPDTVGTPAVVPRPRPRPRPVGKSGPCNGAISAGEMDNPRRSSRIPVPNTQKAKDNEIGKENESSKKRQSDQGGSAPKRAKRS
ncbi:hypothetical protein BJ138DRAFT_1117641 [Hygrophoropsis aurantiaca]|uniref:Uncharacterized protein n=1 Tax=Hygrophoropsis aurantiaca TaxID=72124 RepID=A0ACB7ZYZ6_9AGAM|nr:hypothetical protein BJ138DRAFT_1117641 [Hygrophoropsis aurantiaca]